MDIVRLSFAFLSQNFFLKRKKRRKRRMLIRKNDYIEQNKSSERERKKNLQCLIVRSVLLSYQVIFVESCSALVASRTRVQENTFERVLKNAVLCLDADRSWAFHPFSEGKGSERQISFLKSQFDSRYFDFENDFLAFLREKEEIGLCYWHRPNRNYKAMSKFFESIKDPVEEKDVFYNPLILDQEVRSFSSLFLKYTTHRTKTIRHGKKITEHCRRRKEKRKKKKVKLGPHDRRPRFTSSVGKVVSNFKSEAWS